MLGWLKGKAAAVVDARAAQAQQVAEKNALDAQINRRFPPHILYRTPNHPKIVEMGEKFSENPNVWADILKRYPQPPQTNGEAEQREAELWDLYAGHFTVVSASEQRGIKTKQAIFDYFEQNEKWVFRYYFAATGIVHRTIQEEFVKKLLDWEDIKKRFPDKRGAGRDIGNQFMSQNNAEMAQLVKVTMPAHLEKWGGWFFANIEEAFKKRHEKPEPEDKNVHGEGGFATRGDIDRAARGIARGTASQQEFED